MKALYPHQVEAVTVMKHCESVGLYYQMRLGKTFIAVKWMHDALRDGIIDSAIVVCPKPLLSTWRNAPKEMEDFEGMDPEVLRRLSEVMHVTTYQKVYTTVRTQHRRRDGSVYEERTRALRPEVDRRWGVGFVDESHNLGNPTSIQTRMCLKLATLCDHRFVLSGTVVSSRSDPVDESKRGNAVSSATSHTDYMKLYGQVRFLSPDIWRTVTEFKRLYVTGYDRWGNPKSFDEVACQRLMKEWFLVKRLKDVVDDLPPEVETRLPCPLEERTVYNDFKKMRFQKYGMEVLNGGGRNIKMHQLCSGAVKIAEGEVRRFKTSKEDALATVIDGLDCKAIIYYKFDATAERILELMASRFPDLRTVVYNGSSKTDTWRELQEGDADVLVCQFQCGGCGLTLYNADHIVFYEPTPAWIDFSQAKSRIIHTQKKVPLGYTYIYTEGTVEEYSWKKLWMGLDVISKDIEEWIDGQR